MLARGLVMLTAVLLLAAPATAGTTLTKSERALLDAVNTARTTRGLQPLRVDEALTNAARSYSRQLLALDSLVHGDFAGRLRSFGASAPALGENLAWGAGVYARAPSIVLRWLNSPSHRANLLRPGFRLIGLGAAHGTFAGRGGATVVAADFAGV
jgi:uncharacterized protein YkwD